VVFMVPEGVAGEGGGRGGMHFVYVFKSRMHWVCSQERGMFGLGVEYD
jgi:hypothetical protein